MKQNQAISVLFDRVREAIANDVVLLVTGDKPPVDPYYGKSTLSTVFFHAPRKEGEELRLVSLKKRQPDVRFDLEYSPFCALEPSWLKSKESN